MSHNQLTRKTSITRGVVATDGTNCLWVHLNGSVNLVWKSDCPRVLDVIQTFYQRLAVPCLFCSRSCRTAPLVILAFV